MIPILFSAASTDFSTNGIGRLSDAISCKVTEERNGEYELEMRYPTTGEFFDKIQNNSLIVAKPSYGAKRQAFRAYEIDSSLVGNTCTIHARHISYDLSYLPVRGFTAIGITETLRLLNDQTSVNQKVMGSTNFRVYSDIDNETSKYQYLYHRSYRACLGGNEKSILDTFSGRGTGEFEWDNYDIHFWKHRGTDHGYQCRYGKNIVSLNRDINGSDMITSALGFWHDSYGENYISSGIMNADNWDQVKNPIRKVAIVDFSQDFDTRPTWQEIDAAAKEYANLGYDLKDSIELDFYDQDNQAVQLCDTISVKFDRFGINTKVKVIKTVWDVLLDRYEKITVGSPRSTLADTLYKQR